MISHEQEEAVLRQLSDDIRQLAHKAYQNIVEAILGGMTPRGAINQEMLAAKVMDETGQFASGFYQQFSQGLSAILSQSVSARDVMDIQLDGIKLSDALYRNLSATQSGTIAILRDHFAGIAQARGLALAIYTGYGIPERSGLVDLLNSAKRMGSIGAPGNPKYMAWHTLNDTQLLNRVRDVLRTGNPAREFMPLGRIIRDPAAKAALERIYFSTQAGQLKTPALRAAYLNRITTWATHDAGPARDNAIRVAYEEKMRYMSNRIAQTESHRAYSQALAREFAADDKIQYVQVRAGPGHTPDVCDVHLMANPTGWGRGIYVKGKAPVPAYHPWCKCKLLNREDLDPNYDKPGPKQSAVQYLKTLDEKEAARIVGSKAKWQRVLAGEKLQDVIDGGKPDMYKLKLIKDIAPVKTAPRKQDEPKAYVSPHDFVVHNGTTSEAFKRRVDNAVSLIPENIQQQIIRANGLKITSCQYVTEELPELKGVHPRGWDKLTWANTDGVHYSGKGSYVSERWMHPWHMVDEVSTRTEKVVLHETGHMLEEFLLKNSKDYLEFSNAYNNDIALLTPEQKFDAEYFIQKGKAGREETFAELFSQILMRNGNIKDSESFVLEYFPKSKKVLENAILSYGK